MTAKTKPQTNGRAKAKLDVKPANDLLLVEPDEASDQTEGGVYLPDVAKEKPQRGKVLAAGPGPRIPHTGGRAAMPFEAGNVILFRRHTGTEVTVGGRDLFFVREGDVLAVVGE